MMDASWDPREGTFPSSWLIVSWLLAVTISITFLGSQWNTIMHHLEIQLYNYLTIEVNSYIVMVQFATHA